jgi:hypothetical protein
MAAAFLGILALVLLVWALHAFTKADPKVAARVLKISAGIVLVGAAIVLAFLERFGLALPLGIVGLTLLGLWPGGFGFAKRTRRSPGQVSRVRSAYLEMELDHDTGALHGRVLAGQHEGRSLDDLDLPTLLELLAVMDEESRALLAAYLDRREPAWREHAKADPASGSAQAPGRGPMTQEEAYQILGLEPGASPEEIGRAHRALMKKLHPDQGGSTYLAARINEAKDTLLRRHR